MERYRIVFGIVIVFAFFSFTESRPGEKSDENLEEKSDENLDEKSDENLDEKSDENLDENLGEKSDENLEEKSDENLKEDSDENLEENLDGKSDENLEENSDDNLGEKSDENLEEKSDENLDEKSDENLDENLKEDSDENLEENLDGKSDENLEENSDDNLDEKSDENLEENSDDNLDEEADKNSEENGASKKNKNNLHNSNNGADDDGQIDNSLNHKHENSNVTSKPVKNKKIPNLIYILLDDIGWNDVPWHNNKIRAPYMKEMAKTGVILDSFYAMQECTPSRTSLMTGKYAQQSGLQRGVLSTQEPYGVPLKHIMLPKILKDKANYITHAIGKWHMGYCDYDYTPLRRGFDTFFGFYNGAEENWNHCNAKSFGIYEPITNCTEYDLRLNTKDVHSHFMGQYSSYLYAEYAENIIKNHEKDKPLFMYIALTDGHFPLEPPDRFYKGCENNVNKARQTMCAAMQASDEAIKNITEALKREGLYENSVIVLTSDNGGSVNFAGNNYPFRGNKEGLWEGATRVPAFVHSPLLEKKGYINNGIIHIVDWYTTFMHLAGIKEDKSLGLFGVNQWNAISKGTESPRTDFPYSVDLVDGVFLSAVRKGDYKLIAGPGGDPDTVVTEEQTTDNSFNNQYLISYLKKTLPFNFNDTKPKLFNLKDDPSESKNLVDKEPKKYSELMATLKYYQKIAKNAVKFDNDPAGDPANFGHVFSPGWCNAFYDVPDAKESYYMNINRGDIV